MRSIQRGWARSRARIDTVLAALAQKKHAAGGLSEPEKAFYTGKVQSALWFARNVLPQVEASARSLATEDASALDIPDAALGPAS